MTDLKLSRLVGEFIGEGRDSFTLDDFAGWAAAAGSPFAYRDDLEHAADFFIREGFLSKDREGFRKASSWFRGARFLVSLTDREVRDRVLIPGHRFLPFAANATAPWTCTLKTADGREMEKKTIPIPFGDLGIYVLLFGRESLPVYLLGDRPENGEILASGEITPSAEAVITVFDLAPFFGDPGFAGGDALLLTAEEYEAGIFTLERMPASKIPDEEAKASYVRTLDTAFRAVFRTFGPSISIGQQIGSALYRAGRKILRNPPMHFGGYLAATKKVALTTWLDHSILWSGPVPDEPDEPEDMGTLDRYLTLLGVSLSEEEIQACMRDELFAGGASFDRVNERCFGGRELRFPSKEDRKEFEAHLRELWEETGRVYNLFTDQERGPLRSKALAILDQHTVFLRSLDARGLQPDELPPELFEGAETAALVARLLGHLNEEIRLSPSEAGQIAGMLEEIGAAVSAWRASVERLLPASRKPPAGRRSPRPGSGRRAAGGRRAEKNGRSSFVLKIVLEGIRPPIWRRVRVPGDFSLGDLHQVVQTAMGWTGSHLHAFRIGDALYGDPEAGDTELGAEEQDENAVKLEDLGLGSGSAIRYTYDFGDGWEHRIAVEEIVPPGDAGREETRHAVCLKGKRACPPEDCGGVSGYGAMLEALADPGSEEHETWKEWVGEFDPERFDLEAVNAALSGDSGGR